MLSLLESMMTMRGGQWMMTDISTLLTPLYTVLSFTQQRKQTQFSSVVSTDSDTTHDKGALIVGGNIVAFEIENVKIKRATINC